MFKKSWLKGGIIAAILAIMVLAPTLASVEVPAAEADNDEGYSVDIFVLDNFRRDRFDDIGDDEGNCAFDIQKTGFAVRGAGFALRGAGFATRGAGFATRGAGFATRGAGFAVRGAGFATRGAGFATRGADGSMEINIPHGKIVTWQLEELDYWYGDNVDVNIVKVRANDYRTDRIASLLEKKIRRSDADFIVINMSFAVIPCAMVETLAEYEAELQDSDDYDELIELEARFQELIDTVWLPQMDTIGDDEIGDVIEENISRVIPVASAGNFGLTFPFYPAGWDGVVSVSATEDYTDFTVAGSFDPDTYWPLLGSTAVANGTRTLPVSNYGNVMMPGQYEDIIGASYAAPRLSYAIGYYLTQVGPDYCRNSDGSFALAYGSYDNLTLNEAMSSYCPGMIDNVPEELPFDLDGDGYVPFTAYFEAENSAVVSQRGNWTSINDSRVSGGQYVQATESNNRDRLELDFVGPYIEVWYVDGESDGRFTVEVDGWRRRTRWVRDYRDFELDMTAVRFLSDRAHTLELEVRRGTVAVDGFYTTILLPDPFSN